MNLANLLTLYRIIVLIPFVALFYIDGLWSSWVMIALYITACLTDYFDGLVARKWQQITSFGRFLDPIADKILIGISLLMLAGTGRISGFTLVAAAVILCREILVSGLREFLAGVKVSLPVSHLAKWKTGIQMVAIGCLLFKDPSMQWVYHVGGILLWAAAILTLVTGYDYLKSGLKHMDMET